MSQDLEMSNLQHQLARLTNKVAEHDQTLLRFAALEERLAAVTAENKTLQQENADLRARLAEALAAPAPAASTPAAPTPAATTPAASTPAVPKGTEASQWSTVAARKPKASKGSGLHSSSEYSINKEDNLVFTDFLFAFFLL
ncbi:hypothetical protein BDF20DRAFT_1003225 [Mycotypha africana]|uniref:uncharacterized protein n=1 Tax=Mycotypha africana TaxID=64632 RepID=UPI002301A028|nr:uncharacterized protein BDF20DRAFT_1003225 [Mycotypha africana]KAI8972065.1 hypothetical protein BDF20DRAFT_1003225 [Mycotypha africana]